MGKLEGEKADKEDHLELSVHTTRPQLDTKTSPAPIKI